MYLSRRTAINAGLLFFVAPLAHTANAQIATAVAINRAARFRALSQRCAKAYCQLQQEVMPDSARDVMASAQRLMQVGFEDIGKAGLTGESTKHLNGLIADVGALNTLLASAPTKDGIVAVSIQADKTLDNANKLTLALEASSGPNQSSARLINLAGRQRMLSQRLAKNYFLAAAGVESKLSKEQLVSDRADFKQALVTLNAAPISTTGTRNELQLAQSQWTFFEAALNRKPDMESMRSVATTSERLLEVNNNLTVFYEAAFKELLGST